MNFPRLKHAVLCRILIYIVVLGGFIVPIVVAANLDCLSENVKLLIGLGFVIALLIYLIKNFALLMAMDFTLAFLHCYSKARKRFVLPQSFSVQKADRKISRFGKEYKPLPCAPRPKMLQYKSTYSMTLYASGIERIIAAYDVDFLDKSQYREILSSASANSTSLKGKKKRRFIGKYQKKAPINQATVIIIYANRIDDEFRSELHDVVCKSVGEGYDTARLPCVVDLEKRICTFDSMMIPYAGFQYAVKNRGIKIIRKYLFDNRFPFSESPDMLDPLKDLDPAQSLWSFWRTAKKEYDFEMQNSKRRFKKMEHKDIITDDGYLYLKWEGRGIWTAFEINEDTHTVEVEEIDSWYYPKSNKIAKDTVRNIKGLIDTYFALQGYAVKYVSFE